MSWWVRSQGKRLVIAKGSGELHLRRADILWPGVLLSGAQNISKARSQESVACRYVSFPGVRHLEARKMQEKKKRRDEETAFFGRTGG